MPAMSSRFQSPGAKLNWLKPLPPLDSVEGQEAQNECEEASGQITLASVYATSRDGVKEDDDAVGGFQHRMMMPLEDSNIDPTSNARYDRHVSTKTSSSCCTLC